MGYYIFAYGIDIEKIKAVFHSNSEKTFELIKQTETFECHDNFLPDGYKTTPGKALEDIIKGNPYDMDAGFSYGYALICICDALGVKLPYTQEIKLGYETDLIDKYLAEDFRVSSIAIDDELLDGVIPLPFDIPYIEDWPVINILYKEKLLELNEKLSHITITDEEAEELFDEDDDKGCAYQHIKGLIENITYCLENDLEMITFCH